MKLFTILVVTMSLTSVAFADHHEEGKKKVGHDVEHTHVEKDKVDHEHDEAHHKEHDHKAHHPGHQESVKKVKKK